MKSMVGNWGEKENNIEIEQKKKEEHFDTSCTLHRRRDARRHSLRLRLSVLLRWCEPPVFLVDLYQRFEALLRPR